MNLLLYDDKYYSVNQNVKNTDVIIIDEVSMLSQKDFEQLELICRTAKGNQLHFGGLQVVASGDRYQLPPVPNPRYNDQGQFCFLSNIWENVLGHRIHLTQVVRQNEPKLIQAIRETAFGSVSRESDGFLKSLCRPLPSNMQPVHLFSRNLDAAIYNADCLQKLDGECYIYKAKTNQGPEKYLRRILAPHYLQLKIGCPVMLLRNLSDKLVNGLSGEVKCLDMDSITVHFPQIHQTHQINRCIFSVYDPMKKGNIAEREQFPLTLSYAFTIHKSQGMTLDSVHVHCQGIFQPGQLSVAIGRVKSSDGLTLENYRASLCQQHKGVVSSYYRNETKSFEDSLDCCWKQCTENIVEVADDTSRKDDSDDNDTDDSEFDINDVNVIERFEDFAKELPYHINPTELISLVTINNPVTETQRYINEICQRISLIRLTHFCKSHHASITKMLPYNSQDETSTKLWTAALASYHRYVTSDIFIHSVSLLFGPKTEDQCQYVATQVLFHMLKKQIEYLCENVESTSSQTNLPTGDVTEAGKAKARHVGGMCIPKTRHHFMNAVTMNLGNPEKHAKEKVSKDIQKVEILKLLEADIDEVDIGLDRSLDETEMKQNIKRGLTHITDKCFSFFLILSHFIRQMLDVNALRVEKEGLFEHVRHQIAENEELQMIWAEFFRSEEQPSDLVFSIYASVTKRFLKVCNKQFLKDTKERLNVKKKKAHREEIAKKKGQKKKSMFPLQ